MICGRPEILIKKVNGDFLVKSVGKTGLVGHFHPPARGLGGLLLQYRWWVEIRMKGRAIADSAHREKNRGGDQRFLNFFLPIPARAARPMPRRSMVAGSGTDSGWYRVPNPEVTVKSEIRFLPAS